MFGFGKAECPVDEEVRDYMDQSWLWFIEKFSLDRIQQQPVITPTDEWFPFALDGSVETAERMFRLVCEYMHVEQGEAKFELFDPDRMKFPAGMPYEWSDEGAAGYYSDEGYRTVAVSDDALSDPEDFIATVAHELGHVILLGRGYLDPERDADHELKTDLLTVALGLGIFGANSALREKQWDGGGMVGWSYCAKGYLTFQEWGYANAMLAFTRCEHKPDWARHLRLDIRTHMKNGLKYLRQANKGDD